MQVTLTEKHTCNFYFSVLCFTTAVFSFHTHERTTPSVSTDSASARSSNNRSSQVIKHPHRVWFFWTPLVEMHGYNYISYPVLSNIVTVCLITKHGNLGSIFNLYM